MLTARKNVDVLNFQCVRRDFCPFLVFFALFRPLFFCLFVIFSPRFFAENNKKVGQNLADLHPTKENTNKNAGFLMNFSTLILRVIFIIFS